MNINFSRSRTIATSILISMLALLTVACGSSNDFQQVSGQQTPPRAINFTGRYLGANNLPNNQTGVLDFTVANNGQASGDFTAAAVANQAIDITPGTFPVSGQVNLGSGTFNLTGTIPGAGDFTIAGTLPTAGNQATYQFTINGQTFQGTVQPAAQGIPTPPNNGGGDEDSRLIRGGTLSNFVFTPGGNYNGENPPVDAGSTIAGAVGPGQNGEESATILINETFINGTTATIRGLVISILSPTGQDLVVGQVYPLASNSTSDGVVVALSESVGTNVVEGWSLTESTTGQATITSLTDTSITIEFDFDSVGPNSEIQNNPAAGTFDVSGTVTGNFVTLP
jgi:hypothetical protein